TPAGDVLVDEQARASAAPRAPVRAERPPVAPPVSTAWGLSHEEFPPPRPGGKSLNLARLAGKLPEWIHRPSSIAVPFGAFERVLALGPNRALAEQCQKLLPQAESAPAR